MKSMMKSPLADIILPAIRGDILPRDDADVARRLPQHVERGSTSKIFGFLEAIRRRVLGSADDM